MIKLGCGFLCFNFFLCEWSDLHVQILVGGKGGLGECNCRESWGPAIFSGDLSKRERGDQVGRPKGWYLQGTNQYRLRGR